LGTGRVNLNGRKKTLGGVEGSLDKLIQNVSEEDLGSWKKHKTPRIPGNKHQQLFP